MKVSDAIEKRRSVREYKSDPVEWDKIASILDAGRLAPSSGNLQDWKFILVTDKTKQVDIADACSGQVWMEEAPVNIILVSLDDRNEKYYGDRGKNTYTIQNCAAAAMSMILQAQELGLSSCWVSAFDVSLIRDILSIPSSATPQVILTLGYSSEHPNPPNKLALQEILFFEKFNNRIKDITEASEEYSVKIKQELDDIKGFLTKAQSDMKEKLKKQKMP